MNTFKNAQYTITTSLNEQTASIYIKIINNISYATYEGTFEKSAFRLSFKLAGIYRLINKCFNTFTSVTDDQNYSVTTELEPTAIRFIFQCIIEDCIDVEFDIRLQEKTGSGDGIMSAELERQKQLVESLKEQVKKQASELAELKKQNEELKSFESSEYDELVDDYNELVETHDELVKEKDEITEQYKKLAKDFNDKIEQYNKIQKNSRDKYEALRLNYNELTESYKKLEKLKNIDNQNMLKHKNDYSIEDADVLLTEVFVNDVLYYTDNNELWFTSGLIPTQSPI